MHRQLLKDIHYYLCSIPEKSKDELSLIQRIESDLNYFPITYVHRDDLKSKGFDVSKIDDAEMEKLASKLSDDYCEQLFWGSLVIIADQALDFPKAKNSFCPKCEVEDINYDHQSNKYVCSHCKTEWSDTYVLVQFPDDTTYFENEEIGYPCFNSEDNGARYVSEYEYILQFQKSPDLNSYYQPIAWPDSQQYMDLPDNQRELCEDIVADEKALEGFGSSAMWVPLCLLNSNEQTHTEES